MPREKRKRGHEPIAVQMSNDRTLEHTRKKVKKAKNKGKQVADAQPMGKDISKKILKIAAEQMEEDDDLGPSSSTGFGSVEPGDFDMDSDASEDEFSETEEDYLEYEVESGPKLSEADERALAMFMSKNAPERQTLADVLKKKMDEQDDGNNMSDSNLDDRIGMSLDPKVVEVFSAVGKILHKYTAGKLPKAFKILPALKKWEELLYITKPEEWSPCAVYQGTKIFSSNLNEHMAQRFYGLVLLPRVRDDIKENKKLNYHLYQSLKKALYKPAAFFKGIVFPMCEENDSTLREAVIVSSVLKKSSIPWQHTAAAILRISDLRYNGTASIFLRALLDKKFALPYTIVDGVVVHFLRFKNESRDLPVLWHQALYTFAQRYKTALTRQQKEQLKPLLRQHNHAIMTPLIRNELFTSACRDDEKPFSSSSSSSSSSSAMET